MLSIHRGVYLFGVVRLICPLPISPYPHLSAFVHLCVNDVLRLVGAGASREHEENGQHLCSSNSTQAQARCTLGLPSEYQAENQQLV
jgi:hypothetical protein